MTAPRPNITELWQFKSCKVKKMIKKIIFFSLRLIKGKQALSDAAKNGMYHFQQELMVSKMASESFHNLFCYRTII